MISVKKVISAENYSDYRDIYRICNGRKGTLLLSKTPFHNCQLFTIGNGQLFTSSSNEEVKVIMEKISNITTKKLMLLDLKGLVTVNKVKDKLKPYITKFSRKKYISTNGSEMYTCHVYLKDY